jgi:hypothetical protein
MFTKIIVWLKESFAEMEDASLYTVDFVNGTHKSYFDGGD